MSESASSMTHRCDRLLVPIQKRHSSIRSPSFLGLARTQREGATQRFHLCVGGNVQKTASQPEILEERPEVRVPRIAVEGKTPEVVKKNRGRDHVEYEQQGRLTTIKAKQDAKRTDQLEGSAEHQQQRRHRRRERYPPVGGLRHRRLVVEYLVEATQGEYQDQTQPGNERKQSMLCHGVPGCGTRVSRLRSHFSIPQPGVWRDRSDHGPSALS